MLLLLLLTYPDEKRKKKVQIGRKQGNQKEVLEVVQHFDENWHERTAVKSGKPQHNAHENKAPPTRTDNKHKHNVALSI